MKGIKIIDDPVAKLRERREKICFPIINRGKLWYDSLTYTQLSELRSWYWQWLNVTETLDVPTTPNWINDKLSEEEILL